jgi:hypothetical protein
MTPLEKCKEQNKEKYKSSFGILEVTCDAAGLGRECRAAGSYAEKETACNQRAELGVICVKPDSSYSHQLFMPYLSRSLVIHLAFPTSLFDSKRSCKSDQVRPPSMCILREKSL